MSQFYLTDIKSEAGFIVSTGSASIEIETTGKNKFIKQTLDGNLQSYANKLKIYEIEIDPARDLIHAIEYAIKNSNSGIAKFSSLEETREWLKLNPGEVIIDSKKTQQSMAISTEEENKIELKIVTSSEGKSPLEERFELYPEDLVMEDVILDVTGKKLTVPLSTGKLKFIKSYENEELQNYSTKTEVLFDDVKQAKSFIAVISYLHENSIVNSRAMEDESTAFDYLSNNLNKIEVNGTVYEQKIEKQDNNTCKLKFTLSETGSKGTTIEYAYEFLPSDIDPQNSSISMFGKELKANIVTREKEKLIKPYKQGEAGNFIYAFDVYTDDILTAKKILAAFETLAAKCK
ncbi:hypothetical protein ES705_39791 [subsurface metagenome]